MSELPHNFRVFYEREKGGLIVANESKKVVEAAQALLSILSVKSENPEILRRNEAAGATLEGMRFACEALGITPLADWLEAQLQALE